MAPGLVILALLVFPTPAQLGQESAPRDTLMAVARQIMETTRYCGLVTLNEAGNPRARVMDPFPPDPDLTVWLGTNRRTRRGREVERNPRVVLYYQVLDASGYVTIPVLPNLLTTQERRPSVSGTSGRIPIRTGKEITC